MHCHLQGFPFNIFIKKRKRKPGRLKMINLKKLKEVSSRNDFPE